MPSDLSQVINDSAMQVAAEFNEHWSNYQLDEGDYSEKLVEAVNKIVQLEFEHTIVKGQIQINVQGVIEVLTSWIMENEIESADN
jgi:hypothetical protein